ncbi:MAG: DNA starvation/stationary phase protection protein, partial [Psychrobacter sp.]|nr:DNA starvation/stationary phase protection protein [Psychrobacter sp.]
VTGLQALIEEQREVSALAERAEDQGTADLVDEYVQQQEKLVWMYNAFLAK